jgi:hypothetical protein
VFDWLFEGRPAVYVVLAATTVVLFVAWWQSRKRYWLYATAAFLALIGLYFLLDRMVETDREQIVRKVEEMSAGVRERNVDRIFANVSEQFRLNNSDRAAFRAFAEQAIRRGQVTEVKAWDFHFPDDFRATERRTVRGTPQEVQVARVQFSVKPEGPGLNTAGFLCRATFIRDPDGQLRLLDFQIFNPLVDQNQPIQIPQLPQ